MLRHVGGDGATAMLGHVDGDGLTSHVGRGTLGGVGQEDAERSGGRDFGQLLRGRATLLRLLDRVRDPRLHHFRDASRLLLLVEGRLERRQRGISRELGHLREGTREQPRGTQPRGTQPRGQHADSMPPFSLHDGELGNRCHARAFLPVFGIHGNEHRAGFASPVHIRCLRVLPCCISSPLRANTTSRSPGPPSPLSCLQPPWLPSARARPPCNITPYNHDSPQTLDKIGSTNASRRQERKHLQPYQAHSEAKLPRLIPRATSRWKRAERASTASRGRASWLRSPPTSIATRKERIGASPPTLTNQQPPNCWRFQSPGTQHLPLPYPSTPTKLTVPERKIQVKNVIATPAMSDRPAQQTHPTRGCQVQSSLAWPPELTHLGQVVTRTRFLLPRQTCHLSSERRHVPTAVHFRHSISGGCLQPSASCRSCKALLDPEGSEYHEANASPSPRAPHTHPGGFERRRVISSMGRAPPQE